MREQDRPAGGKHRLHPAAEQARGDRGGSVGAAPGGGPLHARDRDRLRKSRSRVAREARAARRLGVRRRRHVCICMSVPLGPACARRAPAADKDNARLPLHVGARALRRRHPIARVARDLCRRAGVGALLSCGVRTAALGRTVCRRRHTGRVPSDRRAAAREGLSRLGERPQRGDDAGRGRALLRREARQGGVHRTGRAPRAQAEARLPRAGRSAGDRTRLRSGACGGRIVGRVTSGGFGYAVGSSIALAYVPLEYTEPGTQLAVDIFGDWVAAEVRAEPLYDPKGERVRA